MDIKTIGLIVASHRPQAISLAISAIERLKERKVDVLLTSPMAKKLGLEKLGAETKELGEQCDLFISLGGDGAFLTATRMAAPAGKPSLGVHLGGFGFLATVPEAKFFPALETALEGKFEIRERMMLQVEALSTKDSQIFSKWSGLALNEAVVANSGLSRVVSLRTQVGGQYLSGFSADGLIVSTPTGSTAYSLAAGGPVVDPELRAVILTPVCAHTLSARPLVVPSDQEIVVTIGPTRQGQAVRLTVDGQTGGLVESGECIRVREAPVSAKIVSFDDDDLSAGGFYGKLRTKLGWGRRR